MNEIDENTIGETLTPKQEAFCRFYSQDSELFANGTLSYAKAYGYDLDSADKTREKDEKGFEIQGTSEYDKLHHTCRSNASRLLTNDDIIKRVRQLLVAQMTEQTIDARLMAIVMKGEDKDAIQAIKEFNKLKQRITEKKDITSNGKTIEGFNFIRADEPNGVQDTK